MNLRTASMLLFVLAPVICRATSGLPDPRGERPSTVPQMPEGRHGVIESIEFGQSVSDGDSIGGTVIGGVVGEIAARPIGSTCDDRAAIFSAKRVGTEFTGKEGVPVAPQGAYFIRVRFTERIRQSVAQIGLDDLRVGDEVQIERSRVRRCNALFDRTGPRTSDSSRKE